ncbi:unnamed protein product [Prorocentrum cordatum]|uniref:Uncharacterized protein n=1 Tax=Prorocentrum cordatum TaxID=2364126 RepID=A0ABN9VAP2_9DINO|nr:unnamed protein product [Polarella glacialis]
MGKDELREATSFFCFSPLSTRTSYADPASTRDAKGISDCWRDRPVLGSPAARGCIATLSFAGLRAAWLPTAAWSQLTAVRCYDVQKAIEWRRVREREESYQKLRNSAKGKNHKETAKRFRLTRFGWERRRARFHSFKKRQRSWASKRQSRTIAYLHRSDMPKLKKTMWKYRLKIRDFPTMRSDPNPNHLRSRALLPAAFG